MTALFLFLPFLAALGFNSVTLTATAVSTSSETLGTGDSDVELALMLDTTGSMADSAGGGKTKIQALKDAANNLIDILIPDSGTPHAKIGLAPFAPTVKLSDTQVVNVTGLPLTKSTCTKSQNVCVNTTCKTYNTNGSCKTWNQSCTTQCTSSTPPASVSLRNDSMSACAISSALS